MKGLSIIIPTLNEEKNIKILVERIDRALLTTGLPYEIIFIDDYSTDATKKRITYLSHNYPLQFFKKKGTIGKSVSILEGCHYAQYDILAFIDADLQYPPESLPEMVAKMKVYDADIVVTNRKQYHTSAFRQWGSLINRFIFGRLLFGLPFDIQSGMKIFKRKVIENLDLKPSPWSFDLEFLVKSQIKGYKIESVDITFEKRVAGTSKVGFMRVAFELIISSLRLRLFTLKSTPYRKELILPHSM